MNVFAYGQGRRDRRGRGHGHQLNTMQSVIALKDEYGLAKCLFEVTRHPMTPIVQLDSELPRHDCVRCDRDCCRVDCACSRGSNVGRRGQLDGRGDLAPERRRADRRALTASAPRTRRCLLVASSGCPKQHRCCSLTTSPTRAAWPSIPVSVLRVNFERAFEQTVVRPFVADYLAGRTPIPCTLCNNHVKFDQLLVTARQIGAARVATGHYARVRHNRRDRPLRYSSAPSTNPRTSPIFLRLDAGAIGAHRFPARRADEAGSSRDRPPPRRARRGKAGEPGDLFCADGAIMFR